ncbi:MAG: restriction endonuclease subunit S [Planctomycetaceae bacterium]|nr:restriction endonuclease subunit S [Planctomycetaceae bacterium]
MAQPERHRICPWQILIAGAGTLGETELYGRSIIADKRLKGKYVGPDAMVLEFADAGGIDNLFTYAFLCTRIGVKAVRSASYGTKILRIRKDVLQDMAIPDPHDDMKAEIAGQIRKAVRARERYIDCLNAARRPLEEMCEMRDAHDMCGEVRPKCLLWDGKLPTIGAWAYASTGGALGYLKRKWNCRLADVIQPNGLFNGPRLLRVPCSPPHGVSFLNQRDVMLIRPVPRQIVHPGCSDHLLFAPKGTLLVGGRGTLGEGEIFGRVVWVTDNLARRAITEDLLRVQPGPEFCEVAYAYLSTTVGLRLLRSTAVGTKILKMRPDLLLDLPFPELSTTALQQVRDSLGDAIAALAEADQAEQQAIQLIEEEVLPAWLT